ncbi:hypothetical protein D0C16_12870 [Cellvibrio sp. KY-GH-1]|uniref:hypothetical protein n=1 Tax=Cellvibrio sp. KY-GH-1 TaxID=2303332 RepID=UPI0012476944|nr:hypothetical protein [Cellvibrio sp. KY-GH-1]QEY16784.1 hypothetical protein D0C16_12870 [Cellvibrio sp. KY-GH-1]
MSHEIKTQIKTWLMNKNNAVTSVEDNQDILATGVLDSLQFVNFLMLIEKLVGHRIEQEFIVPENFKTIDTIINQFFSPAMSESFDE